MGNLADIYEIHIPHFSKPFVWYVWMVFIEISGVWGNSVGLPKSSKIQPNSLKKA